MKKGSIVSKVPQTQANNLPGLLPKSHKMIDVFCDFQISEKCKKRWQAEYRVICDIMERNDGKVICMYCSRAIKYIGKYKELDDDVLNEVDSEEKAYLLGWIASEGCVAVNGVINIAIHKKDSYILDILNEIVSGGELPISDKEIDLKQFSIYSKTINDRACELLDIMSGNKSKIVNFPNLETDDLKWAFIRGLFDGDGNISEPGTAKTPKCGIASSSVKMKNAIAEFCKITCYISDGAIEWRSLNALDFLSKLYNNCKGLCLSRKELLYWGWSSWVPALMEKDTLGRLPLFKWYKSHHEAVPPYKKRASDSGWDLTLIREIRKNGLMTLYGTGIKITPEYGWYFDLVPRSNIIDTGYLMANSIGVIDRTYTGEIMVGLIKFDPNKPDLALPYRIVQIIPRPIIHAEFIQVNSLDNTDRGEGGFGSTNSLDNYYFKLQS